MIRSMTGFGRAAFAVGGVTFDVELRSVNHRYLDLRVRLSRRLSPSEAAVRARVQQRFARGKVDLSVATSDGGGSAAQVEIDVAAAERYVAAAEQLRRVEGLAGTLDAAALLGLPGVARSVEPDLPGDELERELLVAVDAAVDALDAMRETEGVALSRELVSRLDRIAGLTASIETRSETVRTAAIARLRKRAEQISQETGLGDEARLNQEIVLAADRMDITEELVRLRSHVDQFREILGGAGAGEPVGRRLDFLLQELSREANTIGSKGNDAPIAHDVVELKTEIERIREQVQNVE